jgi:hypothetical protein
LLLEEYRFARVRNGRGGLKAVARETGNGQHHQHGPPMSVFVYAYHMLVRSRRVGAFQLQEDSFRTIRVYGVTP